MQVHNGVVEQVDIRECLADIPSGTHCLNANAA